MNDEITKFATWFRAEAATLAATDSRTAGEMMADNLYIDAEVGFSVARPVDGRPSRLIVSALSNSEVFPVVDAIVAALGEVEGWDITALMQPYSDFKVTVDGFALEAKTLRFCPMADEPKGFHFVVSEDTVLSSDNEVLRELAWRIAETRLGERLGSRVMQVGFAFEPTPEAKPLSELVDFVRGWED